MVVKRSESFREYVKDAMIEIRCDCSPRFIRRLLETAYDLGRVDAVIDLNKKEN